MGCVFRKKGDKAKFDFRDKSCIGLSCWAPGHFQHRGATMSGSRSTGRSSPCCLNRAYHGCPTPIPVVDDTLAPKRKSEGWRAA
jgi:hypothetical protein